MNLIAATTRKFLLAYNAVCKPFCRELGLPQTSFDILMFLGNNPEHNTASDIVEIRNIKANLISVNVDRLVRDGYLTRHAVKGDRRKVELLCTEKAQPIIAEGRKIQKAFADRLFANMDGDVRRAFSAAMGIIEKNLDVILESEEKS